jgi:hypothetical protein
MMVSMLMLGHKIFAVRLGPAALKWMWGCDVFDLYYTTRTLELLT